MFSFLRKRKDKCIWIRFILCFVFPDFAAETTKDLVQFTSYKSYCKTFTKNSLVERFDIKSMLSSSIFKLKLTVFVSSPFAYEINLIIHLFNLTRFTNNLFQNWLRDMFCSFLNRTILRIIKKLEQFMTWLIFLFLLLIITYVENILDIVCKNHKILRWHNKVILW